MLPSLCGSYRYKQLFGVPYSTTQKQEQARGALVLFQIAVDLVVALL